MQLNLKKNIFFTLVYPNLKCSTKKIYSKVKKYSSPISFSKITSNHEYLEFLKNQNNDLQTIVENKYPKIRKLLVEIRNQKNCMFSRMTGSGSACFGLFTNKKYANFALTNVKKKFPSYFCTLVKNT